MAKTVAERFAKYSTVPVWESDTPYWTLDKGLSFSGLHLWLQCQEQFRLKYIQGWRAKQSADDSLLYGAYIHKLIELRPNPEDDNGIREILDKVPGDIPRRVELAAVAAAVYKTYYHFHRLDEEKRIDGGAEKKFEYTYRFTYNGENFAVPMMGYIDCVLDCSPPGAKSKRIGLRETKTRVDMAIDNTTAMLVADLQTNSYFLACEQTIGAFPETIIYDLVKRPLHKFNPEKESLPQFHKRVAEVVEKEPSNYLYRIVYTRSKSEFNLWRNKVLHPILAKFAHWYRRVEAAGWKQIEPYNPAALNGKYGLCDHFHLIVNNNPLGLERKAPER